jgi:ribosomal protein L16 Arg81 hydroxylase
MILDRLLLDVPRSVFMEQYHLKLPFALPGGCKDLVQTAGWPMVEAILRRPGVDLLAVRESAVREGLQTPTDQGRALLDEGYTLRIRKADRHDAGLAELAEGFRRAFAAPIDVHVYCTPAGQPGLGWHYDAEDVFLLQTRGSKQWQLRKNTVNPWPLVQTMPQDLRYQREIMPVIRCDLHAGDWLYLPAGYWHAAQAGAESISLSVGVLSAAAIDVYDFLRPGLLDSLRWRQRLPTAGEASTLSDEQLLDRYREVFADLGQDLSHLLGQEQTARAFLESRGRKVP